MWLVYEKLNKNEGIASYRYGTHMNHTDGRNQELMFVSTRTVKIDQPPEIKFIAHYICVPKSNGLSKTEQRLCTHFMLILCCLRIQILTT